MLLTGLRGVGKTVLLNEIERSAAADGYRTIQIEAHEDKPLGVLIGPYFRQLLFHLNRLAGAGEKVKRGLAVLQSFLGALKVTVMDVTFGLDIDPEKGAADSGDLEIDLPNLFQAVGEAAEDRKSPVALLIDEIQYSDPEGAERADHGDAQGPTASTAAGAPGRRPTHPARIGGRGEIVR